MYNQISKNNMNGEKQGEKLSVCFPTDKHEYVRTGWNSLDERLGGLRNGEIIVVSGYLSMGETTFVTNPIKNISVEQKLSTSFFSFHLPEHMIARTLLSSMSGLAPNSKLTDEELSHLKSLTERLLQAPIFVNNEDLNANLLGSTAAKITRANNIKALFIDGLRNIFCSQFDTSAHKEIFQILKTTARELNVPIIITDTCKAVGDHGKWNSMPYYPNLNYTSYDPVYDACDVMLVLHRSDYFGIIADDCGRNLQDLLVVGIEKNCQGRKDVVEGNYKYTYNNGHLAMAGPLAAARNFLNALERISSIIDQYNPKNEMLEKKIPQLQEIAGKMWKKENELKQLKSELAALDRKMQLELAPPTPEVAEQDETLESVMSHINKEIKKCRTSL